MKERQVAHQVKFYSPIHTIFIVVNCVLILAGLIGFIYGLTHYQIVSNASFIGGDITTVSLFVIGFGFLGLHSACLMNKHILLTYGFIVSLSLLLRLVSAVLLYVNKTTLTLYSSFLCALEAALLLLTYLEVRFITKLQANL